MNNNSRRKLKKVKRLTEQLLKKYKSHFEVSFMSDRKYYGKCEHSNKTIYLSDWFVLSASDEDILDVILHEIGHAILPENVIAHGEEWKRLGRSMGYGTMSCKILSHKTCH